jgi:hypothetical protein
MAVNQSVYPAYALHRSLTGASGHSRSATRSGRVAQTLIDVIVEIRGGHERFSVLRLHATGSDRIASGQPSIAFGHRQSSGRMSVGVR